MPRATSAKIGLGKCLDHGCGSAVWYRQTRTGMMTWTCEGCDHSGYAQQGGEAYKRRLATIADPAAPPAPAPAAPPKAAKPARPVASSVFELGNI